MEGSGQVRRGSNGHARAPLDTTAVVETPEHVEFHFQLAGPARRAAAYAIDLIVRALIVVVIGTLGALSGIVDMSGLGGLGIGVVLLVVFVVEWGYYVLLETLMGGRSLGKRAMRLRVVKQAGLPLGFGDSVLRNLLRAADFLPSFYAIGALVMSQDRLFRRLGDMLAGTLVISEERPRMQRALQISPPPTPTELGRLPERLALSPGDVEAIELFLRRIGELSPGRELELAEMVAPIYARRLGLRYRDPVRFLALIYHRAVERG
jgi:uncharacterized RDD family membrane protein YckC